MMTQRLFPMNLPPQRLQHLLKSSFTVCACLLAIRFGLLAIDPRVYYDTLIIQAPSINQHPLLNPPWSGISNVLYAITNLLVIPVNALYDIIKHYQPDLENSWFPAWPAMNGLYALQVTISQHSNTLWAWLLSPITALDPILTLPGVLDWLSLIAIISTGVALCLVGWLVGELRHYGLVLWTEMTFSEQRQAQYEATLSQQSKDLVSLNRNVDQLSQATSQLHGQTVTDEMTGAFNKRFFVGKLKDIMAKAETQQHTFGLMMMDVDHFKKLNDTYGHAVGDEVLIALAKIAQEHTPKQHAFFCRYGGEEFGIIFDGLSDGEMEATGDAVRAGISAHRFADHPDIRVTISQGLYVVDFSSAPSGQRPDIHTPEDVIKLADAKLYEAKETGRNRLCKQVWP